MGTRHFSVRRLFPLARHTVLFKHTAPNLYDYRLKVCKIVYQPRY